MKYRGFSIAIFVMFSATMLEAIPPKQENDLRKTVDSFQAMLEQKEGDWMKTTSGVLADEGQDKLVQQIEALRRKTAGCEVGDIMVQPDKGVFVFDTQSGPFEVNFTLSRSPVRITSISTPNRSNERLVPLTWDNLESEIDAAAEQGFEGAILVTRNGKIVLHKAFGFSNREKKIKNRPNTVFAIGSAPIDFTHASILILKDQGRLAFSDKITKFFDDVPADKTEITIRQLMTGKSGLPDFHDLPSDKEPDHTWIDRGEAIKRIMTQDLLFDPGKGDRHSHSAWGLLAAIVEVVGKKSYQDFTNANLYEPAGMKDTGFFGDKVPEDKIAVGYGHRKSSEPNSPPNWGKTSWLVMGSGGQISTLMDLYRWEVAIRSGKILTPESTARFVGKGNRISADGDMYGFEFMHSHNPKCMFMLISNTISDRKKRKKFDELGKRIGRLINTEIYQPGMYTFGIAMAYDTQEDTSHVRKVIAGGAAADAGIEAGDQLVSANGIAFGHPTEVLNPFSKSGDKVRFLLRRNGKELEVFVTPRLRK